MDCRKSAEAIVGANLGRRAEHETPQVGIGITWRAHESRSDPVRNDRQRGDGAEPRLGSDRR